MTNTILQDHPLKLSLDDKDGKEYEDDKVEENKEKQYSQSKIQIESQSDLPVVEHPSSVDLIGAGDLQQPPQNPTKKVKKPSESAKIEEDASANKEALVPLLNLPPHLADE